jgi:hypothetical protein
MASWTPEQWTTFFISAGGFAAVLAVQLTNMIISIRNGRKVDSGNVKLDVNNSMTADIHKVTNGPLSNMEQNVRTIVTQAATNAAYAHATAEAAKIQAAVDAAASKETPK